MEPSSNMVDSQEKQTKESKRRKKKKNWEEDRTLEEEEVVAKDIEWILEGESNRMNRLNWDRFEKEQALRSGHSWGVHSSNMKEDKKALVQGLNECFLNQ